MVPAAMPYAARALLRPVTALTLIAAFSLNASALAAGDPIMPLAEVHAGQRCTGYSVVKGTDVASFDVTVEDVVVGDAAEGSPRILVRVAGPAVDATGVGQGFSGSPIYCPGTDGVSRVIGAISESVGQYGGAVALATPIESILGEPLQPPAAARSAPALLRAARPLAAPLSVGGLSAPVAALVQRAAARAHRSVYTVPAAPQAAFPPQVLRPGAAMAVGLASGDVSVSAVGTVTYVDGATVWGFGHPLDSVGRRDLFLQDAYVYAVVDNPVGLEGAETYKLAAPGHDLGTLSGDGISAVVGRLGPLPDRFPLRVLAHDLDTGHLQVTDVSVADESAIGLPTGSSALSTVAPLALAEAAYGALGAAPLRQSASMCVRFEVRERRAPLRFCNTYVGGSGGSADLAAAAEVGDLGAATALLDAYDATPLHLTRAEVNLKLRRGLRQAFLLGARGPSRVRRGHDARLRVRLRRAGGATFTRTMVVHVPRDQRRGDYDLVLTGTPADQSDAAAGADGSIDVTTLFDLGASGTDANAPTTLAGLARAVAGLHRYDGVSASLRAPGSRPDDSGADPSGRPVYRDPELRVSGEVSVPIRVTARPRRRR